KRIDQIDPTLSNKGIGKAGQSSLQGKSKQEKPTILPTPSTMVSSGAYKCTKFPLTMRTTTKTSKPN
ncbi:MAG: hypothetical protein AAFP69_22290, partial [Planctomycetota bacterium]